MRIQSIKNQRLNITTSAIFGRCSFIYANATATDFTACLKDSVPFRTDAISWWDFLLIPVVSNDFFWLSYTAFSIASELPVWIARADGKQFSVLFIKICRRQRTGRCIPFCGGMSCRERVIDSPRHDAPWFIGNQSPNWLLYSFA